MKEGAIHTEVPVVTDDQATIVAQPGKSAFDFPAFAKAAQGSSIVERGFASILAMRADQQHASVEQAPAQRIAVVTAIGDHSPRPFLWTTGTTARNRDGIQCGLGQFYFAGRGTGQLASQRNTLAVDHHHPLRALPTLGFADSVAPFLAGAKLPSKKLSRQSSRPPWSSSDKNARQMRSHTPCWSHRWSRLQQTLGLTPISFGKSRQRAPVLSTQRIPSSTTR